jgi:hypothetical protein
VIVRWNKRPSPATSAARRATLCVLFTCPLCLVVIDSHGLSHVTVPITQAAVAAVAAETEAVRGATTSAAVVVSLVVVRQALSATGAEK